jgi:hypothetical protein
MGRLATLALGVALTGLLLPACGKAVSSARRAPAAAGEGNADAGAASGGDSPGNGGAGSEAASTSGAPAKGDGGVATDGGAAAGGGGLAAMDGGAAGESGAPAGSAGTPSPPAPGLALSAITLAQSLEATIMRSGLAVSRRERGVPVIAGKRALVRAFVQLEPGFVGRELIGVLDLTSADGSDTLVDRRVIAKSSQHDELGSTFSFAIEARDLAPDTKYRVRVLDADKTALARFPAGGFTPLAVESSLNLSVVLVPMIANGQTPPTGTRELEGVRQRLLALYPVSEVTLDVAAPITLAKPLPPNDDDAWGNALDTLLAARDEAGAPDDVFYYGMLTPAASYDAYCEDGCYLGLSYIGGPDSPYEHGSVGLTAFEDGSGASDAWDTLTHELGHALGREHSPCDVDEDVDAGFPYPAGDLGSTYGFDQELQELLDPHAYKDVMGYCTPVWVSDYTYRGLFESIEAMAGQPALRTFGIASGELLRVARIGRSGASSWRADRTGSLGSDLRSVALLDAGGRALGVTQARFRRLDHAPGGTVWLRAAALNGAAWVDLRPLGGALLPI